MPGKSRLKLGHCRRFLVGGCESRQRRQGSYAAITHQLKLQIAQQAHGAYMNRVGGINLMPGKSRLKLGHCRRFLVGGCERCKCRQGSTVGKTHQLKLQIAQ